MLDSLLEKNLLPDWLIRVGIRRLLAQRLREETAATPAAQQARLLGHVADLKTRPIAEDTRAANAQHYEVPRRVLRSCARPSSQVQQLLVAGRREDARRRGGRCAC